MSKVINNSIKSPINPPSVYFDKAKAVELLRAGHIEEFNTMIQELRTLYCMNFRYDLSHVDLEELELVGVDFCDANLTETKLNRSNLENAKLLGATMTRTRCNEAILISADLSCAVISESEFKGANLMHANLELTFIGNSNFDGADLQGARLNHVSSQGWLQENNYTN